MALSASPAFAGPLPDGTRVPVRLVTFVSSKDSRDGDRIEFVVTSNVLQWAGVADTFEAFVNGNHEISGSSPSQQRDGDLAEAAPTL
jgi:hypothetical protein